jgi:hypothetical protein
MRLGSFVQFAAAVATVALIAGCGDSGGTGSTSAAQTGSSAITTTATGSAGKLPRGATSRAATNTAAPTTDAAEEAAEGPAATEASPEVGAEGPAASGDLSSDDQNATRTTVTRYIRGLDRHDARVVCALLAPGTLPLEDLPVDRGGCSRSLAASIGRPPAGGGPAWRRTTPVEIKAASLGDDRARVIATVTHHFSDRKYVSVEDDVVYLERVGGRWLLAKPSGTLYRAVGYPEPPLRALSPPAGW